MNLSDTKVYIYASDSLKIEVGKIFPFDELVEAHRAMDSNTADGKLVIVV